MELSQPDALLEEEGRARIRRVLTRTALAVGATVLLAMAFAQALPDPEPEFGSDDAEARVYRSLIGSAGSLSDIRCDPAPGGWACGFELDGRECTASVGGHGAVAGERRCLRP